MFVVTGQSFVKRQHCALQETSGVDNLVRKEVHLEAISWCKTRGHNDHLLTLFPFPSTSLVFSIMIKASSEQRYIYHKYYKHSNYFVDLLFWGRFGRQGSTDNFCNFAKLSYFWGCFLMFFFGRNKYLHNYSFCTIGASALKSWLT